MWNNWLVKQLISHQVLGRRGNNPKAGPTGTGHAHFQAPLLQWARCLSEGLGVLFPVHLPLWPPSSSPFRSPGSPPLRALQGPAWWGLGAWQQAFTAPPLFFRTCLYSLRAWLGLFSTVQEGGQSGGARWNTSRNAGEAIIGKWKLACHAPPRQALTT